jgi:hypothetical protein
MHQMQAIMVAGKGLFGFKWILRTHYQPNTIQIRLSGHIVGNNEMPNMDGVKGAEKKAYFHVLNIQMGESKGRLPFLELV